MPHPYTRQKRLRNDHPLSCLAMNYRTTLYFTRKSRFCLMPAATRSRGGNPRMSRKGRH